MAIIGASRPLFAKYNNSGSLVSYSNGGVMGALVQFEISIEGDNNNNDFYADNRVKESQKNKFSNGTLTVQTDDLRQGISKAILGIKETDLPTIPGITDVGVKELIYDDDQNTPYLGIGMIRKKQIDDVEKWEAIILTKVKFNVPNDAATTEGESIEWQVPELSASFMRDDSQKHKWKRSATFSTEEQAEAYIRYILNVPKTDNAKLSQLTVGSLELTPEFDPEQLFYTAETENASDVLTAVAQDSNATVVITVNGTEHESGTAVTWQEGVNVADIHVTAADGETEARYQITVTKS